MSDELKEVYGAASKMDRYSDTKTPCNLYRGMKRGSKVGLMVPTLIGFVSKRGARLPDVLVTAEDTDKSPQFKDGTVSEDLVTEGKSMAVTTEMIREGDKYIVKGCRTMKGDFRGLSVFNNLNKRLPFDWYLIDEDTPIPDGLAVTRDAEMSATGTIHYTVAPKDDMTLSLYLVQLKALGDSAKKVTT